jgi:serine/threonine protein phosphatase PrpC
MSLQVVAFTHTGKVRENNEDCLAVGDWIGNVPMAAPETFIFDWVRPVTLLVADGMGGHRGGEIASQWVARFLIEQLAAPGQQEQSIAAALHTANQGVFREMASDPNLIGMGTTVVGLHCENGNAWVFNVGDSPAYRVQDGFLAKCSLDDIREEVVYGDRVAGIRSGIITQALGGSDTFVEIEPHVLPIRLRVGDVVLLCSDGLTDMLSLDDMEAALQSDLTATVLALFEQAMAAGGKDNISVLLARLDTPRIESSETES